MISFRSSFEDDWSSAVFEGPEGTKAEAVLAARLCALDYEVVLNDEDGVPYLLEEFDPED